MKVRKIFTLITTFMLSAILLTGNVTALGAHSNLLLNMTQPKIYDIEEFLNAQDISINYGEFPNPNNYNSLSATSDSLITSSSAVAAYPLDNPTWIDSMQVSWKEGNSTARHTLYSQLGEVYYSGWAQLTMYSNHNGTYYNPILFKVAPDTLFASTETVYHPLIGMNSSNLDPLFRASYTEENNTI